MATQPIAPEAETLADFVLVETSQVDQGDRLRAIDPTWARALGQVMLREGQRTPIEICRLPGQTRWTLVSGGHRLAGAQDADIGYLRAEIVSANRDDRRLREVSENLWRRDLDPIDRAAFVSEAVAIHKRRAGVDPTRDGRTGSAAARWQKAVKDEANDTTITMMGVYGFSDKVAAELGLSRPTIERDLMLYRRLAPSLVERLRSDRHPVARNATQLRALAKLEGRDQARVVELLLSPGASLNYPQPKTVGDAISHPLGPKPAVKPDAEAKRISAFLGAFHRMSLAEKKGALALLADVLPTGFQLVEGSRV